MILTTIEELRLCFPGHAIDHIEPYVGYIDNAEHEFLLPALGQPLYDRLCRHYDAHRHEYSSVDDYQTGYYNRLLLMAQRCVAFDAIGRSLDFQAVSINNAGLNYSSADDYQKADRDAKNDAKSAGTKEAHASLNRLLYELEQWVKEAPTPEDATADDQELFEIATLWKQSRYYYLAAQMLIPSAKTMQEYLNIYDSREKFIQMLPDLRFIQEELIAPAIGEDFLDYLVAYALRTEIPASSDAVERAAVPQQPTATSRLFDRLVHRLRKIEATFLEGRTTVLRIDKERKIAARDEAVMLLGKLCEQIKASQEAILTALGDDNRDIFELSPLYQKPATADDPDTEDGGRVCCCATATEADGFRNNSKDAALFLTPPLL